MDGRHHTDDELLDRLYQSGEEDEHTVSCAACRARWETLIERRRAVLETPETPAGCMEAQRIRIQARIDSEGSARLAFGLRPVFALGMLLTLVVLLNRPVEPPAPVIASGETRIFTEIYQSLQYDEPRAAEPVRAMFEGQQ